MALIAHAGYGFKVKMADIRNLDLFTLLSAQSLENWLDGDGFDENGNITEDVFLYMRPWDYVELIDEVCETAYPGLFASLPGFHNADHDEICVVLKSTYLSAYGKSTVLDPDVLADDDKALIGNFAKTYFDDTARGWIIWPYYG